MERELLLFQELICDNIAELKANNDELTDEFAFTQFVLDSIAEKANINEPCYCNGTFRDKTGQRIEGKISGYGLSPNGEVVNLFYTIFKEPNTENIIPVTKDEYNQAINRMRGFYKKAVNLDITTLEPSSPHYEIVQYINKHNTPSLSNRREEGLIGITSVRMFVISTGFIDNSFKYKEDEPIFSGNAAHRNKPLVYASWDFYKLKDIITSESEHLPIDVDFVNDEVFKDYRIPYVKMNVEEDNYQTLVAILPGKFLYDVYKIYNTDLLQNNVRLFQGFGKVCNKGILETLKTEPHRFLAYNNGLTATASAVNLGSDDDGLLHYIRNFQILNGGQTTASIFNAKKDFPEEIDLERVFVQMKLIVLSENMEEIRQQISLFSNTQTKPNTADYSSNNKFFRAIKKLSEETIVCDPRNNTRFTRWFFERLSKEYTLLLSQKVSNAVSPEMTPREKSNAKKQTKNDFESKFPISQKFTKEDVAKVRTSWGGKCWAAAGGTSLCYKEFGDEMSKAKPDNKYYEDTIALIILLRSMENDMLEFKKMGSEKAPTIMYTIGVLNKLTNGKLSLYNIWKQQKLSDNLYQFVSSLGVLVRNKILQKKPNTSTYKDYAKSKKTWEDIQKEEFRLDVCLDESELKSDTEDEERNKSSKNISVSDFKYIQRYPLEFWKYLKDNFSSEFTQNENEDIKRLLSTFGAERLFSQNQIKKAKQFLDTLPEKRIDEGKILDEITNGKYLEVDYGAVVSFENISDSDFDLFKEYAKVLTSASNALKDLVDQLKRPQDIRDNDISEINGVLKLYARFNRTRVIR